MTRSAPPLAIRVPSQLNRHAIMLPACKDSIVVSSRDGNEGVSGMDRSSSSAVRRSRASQSWLESSMAESLCEHHHIDLLCVVFGLEPRVQLVSASQGFAVLHDVLRHIFVPEMLANNFERARILFHLMFLLFHSRCCARVFYYYFCALFTPPLAQLAC